MANGVGGDLEVPPVRHRQSGRPDELIDISVAQQEHVVDDVIGRGELPVAVVPGELGELEKIECGRGLIRPENGLHPLPAVLSPLGPTDCHDRIVPRRARIPGMASQLNTRIVPALIVASLLSACGGGEMSMTEYVESVDAIFQDAIVEYEEIVASPEGLVLVVGQGEHLGFDDQGLELADFTPQDLHVALGKVAEIQAQAIEAAAAIDPPAEIEEIHSLYFRELPLDELAARAGTAADWQELSDSPEMAAYRDALEADNEVCAEFQATLDATADRGAFVDVPWMPSELSEIVDYALGCVDQPANPQDAYRPPPTSP